MKHLLHKLNSLRLLTLLTLLLGVGGSQVWADKSTLTFTAACGGSGTADDGVQWTVDSDGSESTYDSTKGIHYGTGSAAVQYITLSTSAISGTIKEVVANASTASGVSATVSVTVGGYAFGGDAKSLSSTAKNYTFTGSAKGPIVVTVTKPSSATKALYVKSITVTYETVIDARTAVNLSDFTANNTTLIAGGSPSSTSTSATNDQAGWTAAYTYSSSNTDVATVDANGVIEAVAKGTATITCSLNVSPSDASYKAGTTTSKTIEITVKNPSHIVTFSSNGSTYSSSSVEEGEIITLPAENPKEVNGYTFQGWKEGTITGTTDDEPEYISSSVKMGNADVTYYAVFAEVVKGNITTKTDILTRETTGITATNYKSWRYESKTSGAVYAGNSAGGNSSIQLRSSNNSGIVTTQSGGKVTKIEVEWNSNTSSDRTLNVYGRDNAYNGVDLLYSNATPIGTITYGTTELDIPAGYKYIGIRSENNALYLISVSITWTDGTPDTYAHYCTTVSTLPRPIITMEDVEMTWGDTDKSVAPSATVNAEAYNGSFSYTVDKPGLTVAADGKLTSNTPGTYVVTANIAATAEHQAASTTCTVTVGKKNVTLSFAETTVHKKTSDTSYTQTATATPTEYDGTIAYSKDEESTSENAAVNSSSAAVTFSATGSVIVKATAPATDYYNSAEATYTILIQTNPEILVEDESISYGKTFTVDDSVIEGGDITVTSSNTDVATVDGLVITGIAVGTTTITVATAESDTYVEGEETFTLTVTAPAASADALASSFQKVTATSDITAGQYLIVYEDGGVAFNGGLEKLDAASNTIEVEINNGKIAVSDETTAAAFTIDPEAGTLTNAAGKYIGKTASGNGLDVKDEAITNTFAIDNGNAVITASGGSVLKYNSSIDQNRFRYYGSGQKAIQLYKLSSGPAVKLNASGYATYCSEYPLDFTDAEANGYSAWAVTGVEGENITFSQITGIVPGGTGLLLKGTAGATVELVSAESTTKPTNLLEGTLAPTYVAANAYYGLSGNTFKKINAGTVPAHKAMLPASAVSSQSVKAFTFVFGGTTTGVNAVDNGQWTMDKGAIFSLSGQRLAKPQKGINIINGKKVLVK